MAMENEISHKHILDQVEKNSDSINDIHTDIKNLRTEIAPIRSFFDDIDTAARFGRGVRAFVGWVVVIVGFFTMIYIIVVDAVSLH